MSEALLSRTRPLLTRPRLGFIGVGWIGRLRMAALAEAGLAEIGAIYDPAPEAATAAAALAGPGRVTSSLDDLLGRGLDGVVIATPNASHAELCLTALARGLAVFCQKPLGRTRAEVAAVVAEARRADRLLGVDLSYRHIRGLGQIRDLVRRGDLGRVYALDLVFHNAYGPDKAWFYDRELSGGGCVLDLGVHLVDLVLWLLDAPGVRGVSGRLYAEGERLRPADPRIEDYATAELELAGGVSARLACSWRLAAGRDAVIEVHCHGTTGGASLRNVAGSFLDFEAERYRGTARTVLSTPPEAWGGKALVAWASQLAADPGFDPAVEQVVPVAAVIDAIYQRAA